MRVSGTTKDGLSGQASAISFTKVRRGKVIFARDYFFDPTFLDCIWGHADEEAVATAASAIGESALRVPAA